ncbi:MAG TPA: MSMEG_6728 family protein, partial [Actinopolymorphaceae bacterium]
MQTFLPYPDFRQTARVLDPKRLGNQRSETLVIVRVCHIRTYGWQNHPAVTMWRGYEQALISYGAVICAEWRARGHADTVEEKLLEYADDGIAPPQEQLAAEGRLPPWLG